MTIKRKCEIETSEYKIGDQIMLGYGFTATCQKITHGGKYALFLLDQCLDEGKTYEEVQVYMNQIFTESGIFDSVKDKIVPFKSKNALRLPYAEEFFGTLDWVLPSNKKQWSLMKDFKNRIGYRNGHREWCWLTNPHINFVSYFADVNANGAGYTVSVRPVFRLEVSDDQY